MVGYVLELEEDRVVLRRTDTSMTYDEAAGVDAVSDAVPDPVPDAVSAVRDAVPDAARAQRRNRVSLLFPSLCKRLARHEEAPWLEVQVRRVCREWTLEDVDAGGNLGSVGMALLAVLCLQEWHGMVAELLCGTTTGAAVVGLRSASGLRVVDTSRGSQNALDLLPRLHLPEEDSFDLIRRSSFLEILQRTKWHLAYVTALLPDHTVEVTFCQSGTRSTLPLRQHVWRHAARSAESELDRVLRRLIKKVRRSERSA